MPSKSEGLRGRYEVFKIVNEPYQQRRLDPVREPCFVLKPDSDPIAKVALQAYAEEAARQGYEPLAEDLFNWLREL